MFSKVQKFMITQATTHNMKESPVITSRYFDTSTAMDNFCTQLLNELKFPTERVLFVKDASPFYLFLCLKEK